MTLKHFNLKGARKTLVSNQKSNNNTGRRKFMKAMGLGAFAWNPVVGSIRSIALQPFEIRSSGNNLKIIRNGLTAWSFDDSFFKKGFTSRLEQSENRFELAIKGLNIVETNLHFDLKAIIEGSGNNWLMNISIPELNISQQIDFLDFLDGIERLESKKYFYQELVELNHADNILLNGTQKIKVNNRWEINFEAENGVTANINNQEIISDRVTISPNKNEIDHLLNIKTKSSAIISLPHCRSWNHLISNLNYNGNLNLNINGDQPDLNFIVGTYKNGKKLKATWVYESDGNLLYSSDNIPGNGFSFNRYIYFAEYKNGDAPFFYLTGKLKPGGRWYTTQIGAFQFTGNTDEPEFEATGIGNSITDQFLEPRLRAFKPIVGDAVTLSSTYQDPPKVRLSTQTPIKRVIKKSNTTESTQNPVKSISTTISTDSKESSRESTTKERETSTQTPSRTITTQPQRTITTQPQVRPVLKNQPKIDVEFDKVKFKPKKALTIKVLRPEDMIWLELEFHNFKFTNKGQAPYVELDNPKKKGVIIIYFPTQHTLEEAFYETNNIPGVGSDDEINLPAKHLRARKSRLVYELPEEHEGFPLIMKELLDWSKFSLRVHPRAWIKLGGNVQTIITRFPSSKKQIPNRNTKYLDTNTKDYAIKLTQKNKVSVSKNMVYNEPELNKVLSVQSTQTLKPSFNISKLKKISLKVGPVDDMSTSIEAPTLMYISPNQVNDFFHKSDLEFRDVEDLKINTQLLTNQFRVLDPLTTNRGEITELWHTKMGVKLKNGTTSSSLEKLKTIRALWADDATDNYEDQGVRNAPFMASLDANNRQKLVHTTSNYGIKDYYPTPVPVKKLMLTTLGAYLDWHVFFDVPNPADTYLNIIEWEHLATLGRDHFVKIVEEGYLFPFGHRAAIVTITERKFHKETKAAVNRQRKFIVVLEKEVYYDRVDPKNKFIEFPFQEVRIENNQTPNIDNPEESTLTTVPPNPKSSKGSGKFKLLSLPGSNTTYNFLINVNKKGFLFDIVLIDKDGLEHRIRMPLGFMENYIARKENLMEKVIEEYHLNKYKSYTDIDFFGQEVAYAESLVDGDTKFETENMLFGAQTYPAKGEGTLKFHPKMRSSKIYIQQVDEMTGIRKPAEITLEDDNNDGHVFAKVADAVVDFSGGSDKSGGFLSPNMAITALSRLQGPVGGEIDALKDLTFNPDDFFAAMEDFPVAKIFGVIKIFDLLLGGLDLGGSFDGLINSVNSVRQEIEDLKNEILYLENLAKKTKENLEDQINDVKQEIADKVNELLDALNGNIPKIPNFKAYVTESAFYAEYKWQPEFKSNPIKVIDGILHVDVTDKNKALTIITKFEKPFDAGKSASLNGSAKFEKFTIDIVPLLAVKFNYLEFKTGSSEKTDVKVDMDKNDPIAFKGALSFVNNLQSIIPSTGFSEDGPYIDISPTGVKAGFDISVPNVEVGICMISNITLGACVTLPFTGAPLTLGLNFCKRENPFLLTISCFGGGGFFMMVTTLEGIQSIEAAFEFGAAVSLNIGVASGGVSIMGGFYFKLTKITQEVVINGENEEIEVNQVDLTGYIRINGHLSILGLISVSLEFYLALEARFIGDKVEKMEGVATLKVKVEVLFFSKTVSVTVRRELKGADADPKFIEMIDEDDWQEYCLAFAS